MSDREDVETYGDEDIASKDAPVPKWLIWIYITLPIWGIITFMLFWNGSSGWLDRGYWKELQIASKTTFPELGSPKID